MEKTINGIDFFIDKIKKLSGTILKTATYKDKFKKVIQIAIIGDGFEATIDMDEIGLIGHIEEIVEKFPDILDKLQ